MADVEIGIGKSGRRAYSLDEISIVPARRTRDASEVDLSWQLDAFRFELPFVAAPSDAVVSPTSAVEIDRLGGLAVLDLEGLWTRYEDPEPLLEEIAGLEQESVTRRLQELYSVPVRTDLVTERVRQIAASGAVTCGALSPQRAEALAPAAMEGELDVLVVQGTVVSAEHVSKGAQAGGAGTLDLARFIREIDLPVLVGGCASYQAALHLMRTGAVGVIVGVGSGGASTTGQVLGIGVPAATAIADAAGARSRHLEETGVYVHVVAGEGVASGAGVAKALACGADAVMLGAPLAATAGAPGRGSHWVSAAGHARLPRGTRIAAPVKGSLEEVLLGPSHGEAGSVNLFGALRKAVALCGYANLREFHKADVVVSGAAGQLTGAAR
ncbi:MAG: dehydrogenase family protein [Acidimicrobiaceae bacterium]|nr:dehydrogenase family protein [Acidimicrobiaceae bacterium]